MTEAAPTRSPGPLLRGTLAVLAGLVAIIILSLATDQVFHSLGAYPPWGEPMHEPALNALALSYRIVFGVLGGFITAALAPHRPMWFALVLGILGTLLSGAGAFGAIAAEMGPAWYPIALATIALPCALLGGWLHNVRSHTRDHAQR